MENKAIIAVFMIFVIHINEVILTCQLSLLKFLFHPDRYDIDLHPFNHSDPLNVYMDIYLYQVMELVSMF